MPYLNNPSIWHNHMPYLAELIQNKTIVCELCLYDEKRWRLGDCLFFGFVNTIWSCAFSWANLFVCCWNLSFVCVCVCVCLCLFAFEIYEIGVVFGSNIVSVSLSLLCVCVCLSL